MTNSTVRIAIRVTVLSARMGLTLGVHVEEEEETGHRFTAACLKVVRDLNVSQLWLTYFNYCFGSPVRDAIIREGLTKAECRRDWLVAHFNQYI